MFTVLGASGFVGSHLVKHFLQNKTPYQAPARNEAIDFQKSLGHVIYCIGYTADFRNFPLETAQAHVCVLVDFLKKARFDSFLYLSSTRVYENASDTDEGASLSVNPNNPNHIFNATKIAGEACCLANKNQNVRIARLSNVLGADFKSNNFVFSVMRDLILNGQVTLQTAADSTKDYIWIDDVVSLLPKISQSGRDRVYNVASGKNLSHQTLLAKLSEIENTQVSYAAQAQTIRFPQIDVSKIKSEFNFSAQDLLSQLGPLYSEFRDHLIKRQ